MGEEMRIFRKVKAIKGLRGGVYGCTPHKAMPKINAEIAEKSHFEFPG